ncbi:MAG: PepSY protein [Myxococcales bacterium]|nr:PepSY protein [Myxococcales bacterium]
MRRVHRIATILVGVPLLVWTATGFAFTWFDFAAVRGERDRVEAPPVRADEVKVALADVLARAGGQARSVELRSVGGRATWIVDGRRIDAGDGSAGAPLGERAAAQIARDAHRQKPAIGSVVLLWDKASVVDLDVPVWRVRLDDDHGSEVFVSPATGKIVAWRNRAWRRFDALWSLHVFGFVNRDNPAQLPLRIAGGLALLTAMSGAWLLLVHYARRTRRVA